MAMLPPNGREDEIFIEQDAHNEEAWRLSVVTYGMENARTLDTVDTRDALTAAISDATRDWGCIKGVP